MTSPRTPQKGSPYTKPRAIPDVEDQPCEARSDLDGGNHVLVTETAGERLLTRCVWCRVTWAALDEALRSRP